MSLKLAPRHLALIKPDKVIPAYCIACSNLTRGFNNNNIYFSDIIHKISDG